jgi:hypothetical protein
LGKYFEASPTAREPWVVDLMPDPCPFTNFHLVLILQLHFPLVMEVSFSCNEYSYFSSFPYWPVREDSSHEGGYLHDYHRTARRGWGVGASSSALCSVVWAQRTSVAIVIYLNGLLLAPGRRSAEPMAVVFGEPEDDGISQNQVLTLQRFLAYSPWRGSGNRMPKPIPFAKRDLPSVRKRVKR